MLHFQDFKLINPAVIPDFSESEIVDYEVKVVIRKSNIGICCGMFALVVNITEIESM
jgi:ribosomal protein S26